ncbi:MAG: ATP phosphoribosyltransferase regulatory subunit, partial [Candidatus Competibacter sp.]
QAVAQGGRYDEIGQVFGRARPATGFSTDLAILLALGSVAESASTGIYAPALGDPALERRVASLRGQGERVVRALPGAAETPALLGCDRILMYRDNDWLVVPAVEPPVERGRTR